MNSDYKDIFNWPGPLARALPNYAYRPEQAVMAKAVGAALARWSPDCRSGHGTGKTFAYLIPALLSTQRHHLNRHSDAPRPTVSGATCRWLAKALGLARSRLRCSRPHQLSLPASSGARNPTRHFAGPGAPCRPPARAGVRDGQQPRRPVILAELTDLPEQSPVWAQHHLDSRELSGPGVRAILTLPCVRRPPQRAGRRHLSW